MQPLAAPWARALCCRSSERPTGMLSPPHNVPSHAARQHPQRSRVVPLGHPWHPSARRPPGPALRRSAQLQVTIMMPGSSRPQDSELEVRPASHRLVTGTPPSGSGTRPKARPDSDVPAVTVSLLRLSLAGFSLHVVRVVAGVRVPTRSSTAFVRRRGPAGPNSSVHASLMCMPL